MSLKPQAPRAMPEDLARLGAHLLASGSPYRLVGDELYAKYKDEDYADLYPAEGQPGLSPVDLAFVTAFQFLEDLPDRAAAEAVRLRLDWKYALHLPLEYAGFNFSVLSEYRARLLAHGAEARVFETLLADLVTLGLLKRRGRQRTDSLAVQTRVRALTRLELVVETLRVAVRALVAADAEWARCVLERLSERERAELQQETGGEGQWLLVRLAASDTPAALRALAEVQGLARVWAQQYEVREQTVVWQEPGPYDGTTRIQSPHDPDARYSRKRDQEWIGNKLQVTESDDADLPHLITDIALTSSVQSDPAALGEIQARQQQRDVLPTQRLADAGYISGPTLTASAAVGEDLVGPAAAHHAPQTRLPAGLTQAQFTVDLTLRQVQGPAGATTDKGSSHADGRLQVIFAADTCAACPLRPRCCTGSGGRSIMIGPHHAALQAARIRQHTADFQQLYRGHRGGVEGCLSALVRGQGVRVNRYIGDAKNNLRALFVGVGVNLRRAARWRAGIRPQLRRCGLGLVA
ncbi:MAG: transposase [Anaerolineae bacterium]|nr:transposase [Anaerolineae bacterium]